MKKRFERGDALKVRARSTHTRKINRAKNRAYCFATRNKQNSCRCWRHRSRGFAVYCVALTPLVKVVFKQEEYRRENQEPGELCKIACHLSGCFEKAAHNRSNQPGQHRTNFHTRIRKTISQRLAGVRAPTRVRAPTTAPIVTPAARKIVVNVTPYLLKISLILFERSGALSLSAT